MNKLQRIYWIAKGVGWENLPRRLLHMARIRTGWLRRRLDPAAMSDQAFLYETGLNADDEPDRWADRAGKFLAIPGREEIAAQADDDLWRGSVLDVCEKALAGEYPCFSRWTARLGWPPNFNLDAMHGIDWPVGEHHLATAHSGPPRHDIKLVWEPSRFTLAYSFARAYARDGDARWSEAFWTMFDAWVEQNPPQMTVAWGCAQEMSFRLMAMLFAACVTLDSGQATPGRLHQLTRLAWRTGIQIDANINYARSQGNNHALSESAMLWTIGHLFPELPPAAGWRDRGRDVLTAEVGRQVYDDGSYVQHSMNYHRVMLDDLLWVVALSRRVGASLPTLLTDRLTRAADWLAEMLDPQSGRVPNYGANDGANVLPLSCSDYLDYRPVVQACWLAVHGRRLLEPGPWDEKALWLLGPRSLDAAVAAPPRRPGHAAAEGGYYILRGPNSWAMTRCHSYRHRPSQCDMLHLDLWHNGCNVLRDGGSYLYYCEEPWGDYFNRTAAHNTLQLDDADQMTKGPRFLRFHWTRARCETFEFTPQHGMFRGRLLSYGRRSGKGMPQRTIHRHEDVYLIRDDAAVTKAMAATLRWRLAPAEWTGKNGVVRATWNGEPYVVAVRPPDGGTVKLSLGQENPRPEGWESLYYGEKTPAPTLLAEAQLAPGQPARWLTVAGPAEGIRALALQLPRGLGEDMAQLLTDLASHPGQDGP